MHSKHLQKTLMILVLASQGCAPANEDRNSYKLKGLAAVDRAHNIAVLGSGSAPGVSSSKAFDRDIEKMAAVLRSPPYNYEVRMRGNIGMASLQAEIAKAASDLKKDGTLLFFFSGHGANGGIYRGDDRMSARQLNDAAAHGDYARFTAIIEACQGGYLTSGSYALSRRKNFKSLLVITSSSGSDSSYDNGVESYFPKYLQQSLVELAQVPTATVRDLTRKVFEAAQKASLEGLRKPSPAKPTPGNTLPANTIPGSTLPGQTVTGQTLPGKPATGQTSSVNSLPANNLPVNTIPGNIRPGQTLISQTLPGKTVTGQSGGIQIVTQQIENGHIRIPSGGVKQDGNIEVDVGPATNGRPTTDQSVTGQNGTVFADPISILDEPVFAAGGKTPSSNDSDAILSDTSASIRPSSNGVIPDYPMIDGSDDAGSSVELMP